MKEISVSSQSRCDCVFNTTVSVSVQDSRWGFWSGGPSGSEMLRGDVVTEHETGAECIGKVRLVGRMVQFVGAIGQEGVVRVEIEHDAAW